MRCYRVRGAFLLWLAESSAFDPIVASRIVSNPRHRGSPAPPEDIPNVSGTAVMPHWPARRRGARSAQHMSRRDVLGGVTGLGIGGPLPTKANAALYQKEEVLQGKIFLKERGEKVGEILANVRKASRDLDTAEAYLDFGKISQFRMALRKGSLAGLRKDSSAILSLLDGATLKEATVARNAVIASLEKLDAAASKAEVSTALHPRI